ncbi:MAG: histidine kinase dimerization/phospho-acceptor domain-containing protein, partial [Gammaproteobacteria bacterium]
MLESFVAYRLDLLFHALLCCGVAWLGTRLVPERVRAIPSPRWFWPGFALLALGGALTAYRSGESERARLHDLLEDTAPTYADAMVAMGLMTLGPDSRQDDPAYRSIDAAQEKWLAHSEVAADIYVLMRLDDGSVVHIVDSETDFDRDGVIDHAEEQRTPIGTPYTDDSGEILRAFLEKGQFSGNVYSDAWGTWVSAYVWLWNDRLSLPLLVGVDYRARDWLLAIVRERGLVLSTFLLLVGVLVIAARSTRLAHAELDAEHAVQESLRLERERADQANRAKTQFLAAMSHEIRTPMSGVLGMIELLRHGRLDAEQREQVETAFHSAHALLDIV